MDKGEYDVNFSYLYKKIVKKEGGILLSIFELGEFPFNFYEQFEVLEKIFSITKNQEPVKIIYKHKSGFYIYLQRVQLHYIDIKLLYKPENLNEVEFFINRLKKITHD